MNSYNILRPFKYSKLKNSLISIALALTMITIPVLLAISMTIPPIILLIIFFTLFAAANFFESKILYKTEIIGQISIDKNIIITNEKQFDFNNIIQLKLSNYISPYKSWIPRWKYCNKLEIKLNDNSEYEFLISKTNSPETIDIFALMEEIKKTDLQHHRKIILHN